MKPFTIDATATYKVAVAVPVKRGPFSFLPRDKHEIKGELLQEIVDDSDFGWEAINGARASDA